MELSGVSDVLFFFNVNKNTQEALRFIDHVFWFHDWLILVYMQWKER